MRQLEIPGDPSSVSIEQFLANLPDDLLVCEVGGGGSRKTRADWVIDVLPFPERGGARESDRVNAERWIVHNISAPGHWPVPDDAFDFTICSHTLEDVANPLHVIL